MGTMTNMSVTRLLFAIVALLGAASPLQIGAAAVQEAAYGLPVKVYACDADVPILGSASGAPLPDECRGLAGVTVTAYTEEGTRLDACTTGERAAAGFGEGSCSFSFGPNGLRIYELDTSTLPAGYRARANVIRAFTYTEFGEVRFIVYRADVPLDIPTGDATLRIHSRVCPGGYGGEAFFADCHHTVPARSQWVFANGAYAATGSDGNAVLRDLPAGVTRVYAGQNRDTGDVFFYCSETADLAVRREATTAVVIEIDDTRHLRGTLTLEPGDDITCDWYVIPGFDRGLWSSVEHWLADDEPDVTYPGATGEIALRLFRCPDGYAGPNPTKDCVTPENFARVRATSSDGREYDVAVTNTDGYGVISLSGFPVTDFWITLDGHATVAADQFWCRSNDVGAIAQAVVPRDDGWTVETFGDDPHGLDCDWYLVPTG